jgi:aminopeptidase-like protein
MLKDSLYSFCEKLWPINRSLTGEGVRKTLAVIREQLPELLIQEVASGSNFFDWTVPKEWKIQSAYIVAPDGKKICDFSENNLHIVGYSIPIESELTLKELDEHLYSLPAQPDAIPYVTSYYQETWGFCLTHAQRENLREGTYKVHIKSELFDGSLSYGELLIPGQSDQEILISTYVCHPSMANNELSGPAVATHLAREILDKNENFYSYRFIFIPETIGSIVYIAKNFDRLKKYVVAGFNLTCIGDNRKYSYLPSRKGDTLSDQVAMHVLGAIDPSYEKFAWGDRGSDERQFCAPGIDLPIASIMRSKYGTYPEYHTSLDKLGSVVTPDGLLGGFEAVRLALEALENNTYPKVTVLGEPQLGKRGMYPTTSMKHSTDEVKILMEVLTWSDGEHSLLDIADKCGVPIWELYSRVKQLSAVDLISLNRTRDIT